MHPVKLATVHALRQKAKHVQDSVELTHSAEALWSHITNNDIIDKKLGIPPLRYSFEPEAKGGSYTYAESKGGLLKESYYELPYEWLPPYYFGVERIFQKAALFRYLAITWTLQDLANGNCLLSWQFRYVPNYPFIPITLILKRFSQQFKAIYLDIDSNIPKHTAFGFEAFLTGSEQVTEKAADLMQKWQHLSPNNPAIPNKLAEYIFTVPDKKVLRMRPFEVADYLEFDRMEVLRFFLLATRQGFFHMTWDLLCPSCMGAGQRAEGLLNFSGESHCPACNIHYDANFDENVEVTFRPHETLRELDTALYCFANPANNPHVWSRLNLEPEQTREETIHFVPGRYRLSCPTMTGDLRFVIEASGIDKLSLALDEMFTHQTDLTLQPQTVFNLKNCNDEWKTIKIERTDYNGRFATAALVTTLQDFRDLFSAEVLRPGLHLGVSNLVILFTDLKSSTELYEKKGDAGAFALVQEHFDIMIRIIRDYQGGVVKTIGDAVMAVFTNVEQATAAGISILQKFAEYNQNNTEKENIVVKLGLHKGACIALNLNDKLDYFGSTVNIAARVQGQSVGDDLVLSAAVHESVAEWLAQQGVQVDPFRAKLKGIQMEHELFRVRLAQSS